MSVSPDDERVHADAATSAVTFSFADAAQARFGLIRIGLSGEGTDRRASTLGLIFAGQRPAAALVQGDLAVAADADWAELALPGASTTVRHPLQQWTVRMETAEVIVALVFTAMTPPGEREDDPATTDVGGMAGYEQLCRVDGDIEVDGERLTLENVPGQRGHAWGQHDWERLETTHTVSGWLAPQAGFTLTSLHAAGDDGHQGDARWATLLTPDAALTVDDPRLSTTYDDLGRPRRVGLELWVDDEDDRPRRAAATVLCGSTLELGQLRLECAFLRWTMDGREGVGRYDLLRTA